MVLDQMQVKFSLNRSLMLFNVYKKISLMTKYTVV